MADLQDTLHSDTVVWLTDRDAYRDEYVSAWVGPAFYPEGPAVVGFPDQNATPFQCEVTYNDGFAVIDPGFYVNKNSGSAVTAWPTADGVTKELIDGLGAVGQDPIVLEKAAKWQLQINALEAFRRTLLNQRQRRKQLLTAYRARWDMETQSQTELKAALQNAKLGQKSEPPA